MVCVVAILLEVIGSKGRNSVGICKEEGGGRREEEGVRSGEWGRFYLSNDCFGNLD